MATHSSILACKIPWIEELVGYGPQGCKGSDTTAATSYACLLVITSQSGERFCLFLFYKDINPIMRTPLPWLNLALINFPNIIISRIKVSTHKFQEKDTNVQSIAEKIICILTWISSVLILCMPWTCPCKQAFLRTLTTQKTVYFLQDFVSLKIYSVRILLPVNKSYNILVK